MGNEVFFSPSMPRPYGDSGVEAVSKAIKSGHLSVVFGRETMRFENAFAKNIGTRYAVATSSGTSALEMALHGLGIGYEDEVIVPAYTFAASALAVLRNLALVTFADIDRDSWNLSLETIQPRITDKTKAIIVVHMFGNPVDMEPIVEYANKRGIFVIEDCAQAAGATLNGKPVGSFGHIGCLSFNEIKNLTTGEGGMITTNDPVVCERARLLRLHGAQNGVAVDLGYKCTMTEMEAALGRDQLARLSHMNGNRQEACYHLIRGLESFPGISVQQVPDGGEHVYSRFVLRISPEEAGIDRDTLSAKLKEKGFFLSPVYPVPLYKHPVFQDISHRTAQPGLAASYVKIYKNHPNLEEYKELFLPEVEAFCREQIGFIVPEDVTVEQTSQLIDAIHSIKGGKVDEVPNSRL